MYTTALYNHFHFTFFSTLTILALICPNTIFIVFYFSYFLDNFFFISILLSTFFFVQLHLSLLFVCCFARFCRFSNVFLSCQFSMRSHLSDASCMQWKNNTHRMQLPSNVFCTVRIEVKTTNIFMIYENPFRKQVRKYMAECRY